MLQFTELPQQYDEFKIWGSQDRSYTYTITNENGVYQASYQSNHSDKKRFFGKEYKNYSDALDACEKFHFLMGWMDNDRGVD